jgi:hypothetical protein
LPWRQLQPEKWKISHSFFFLNKSQVIAGQDGVTKFKD